MTAFVRRETFLAAVFLWKIPLDAALLISEIQAVNASFAAVLSPAATAASTFLIYVFTFVLIATKDRKKGESGGRTEQT